MLYANGGGSSIDGKAEVTRRSCGYTNDALSDKLRESFMSFLLRSGGCYHLAAAVSGTMFLPEIFAVLYSILCYGWMYY
ncbi:hypothetical protein ACOSQ3_022683 [Xanthoceras sorbifolium]